MAARRRWTTDEILDTATDLLRTDDASTFSVRKVAAALGTDSSSLYRHFRSKTELLRAVADRILAVALDGYAPEGDWRERVTALASRVRDAFLEHPEVAVVWGRYGSSGPGSRRLMDALLAALRTSGVSDDDIPLRYHRLAVLIPALISSDAGLRLVSPADAEQGRELFRVAVLGADPERYPALADFSQRLQPLGVDRDAAFADLLAAHLDSIGGHSRGA